MGTDVHLDSRDFPNRQLLCAAHWHAAGSIRHGQKRIFVEDYHA